MYEDKAYYNDVKNIFTDEINNKTDNNIQVILNKYINTLKIFGLKIKKYKNKYILENGLFQQNYTNEDIKAISILLNAAQNFPDEKIQKELLQFINNLFIRMNNEDKILVNSITNNYNFSFYYKNLTEQIEACKKICANKFLLEITYLKNDKTNICKCVAQELIYDTKTVYLKAYNTEKNEYLKIPISNILNIIETPTITSEKKLSTTVVYRIKGRLAKVYKTKQNEYLSEIKPDGSHIIVNKDEPFDELISRLMRYTSLCEIISPKFVREKMIDTINKTLEKYK